MAAVVELPILGLLRERPLYGYELKRRLESVVGFFGAVSYGSLYPMLRTLEIRRQVTHTSEMERGLNRIVYRLTAEGKQRFAQLMDNPDTPLTQKLLFFEAIPPAHRRGILETHKQEWLSKLMRYREEQRQIDADRVDRYRTALLAREVERLEKDIVWLDKLIDEEAANPLPARDARSSRRRRPSRSKESR